LVVYLRVVYALVGLLVIRLGLYWWCFCLFGLVCLLRLLVCFVFVYVGVVLFCLFEFVGLDLIVLYIDIVCLDLLDSCGVCCFRVVWF